MYRRGKVNKNIATALIATIITAQQNCIIIAIFRRCSSSEKYCRDNRGIIDLLSIMVVMKFLAHSLRGI